VQQNFGGQKVIFAARGGSRFGRRGWGVFAAYCVHGSHSGHESVIMTIDGRVLEFHTRWKPNTWQKKHKNYSKRI